ncbi:YtxH domain-containing protein [Flavobacterium sp. J49]|uniref:YtxH domain-containing protein n=1 Tax=Flavobacterium sp. J49 TaxID=2718534 RepID=UPI0015949FD5|nr:YtxH domain-containing protein [Flavobacterium sp. J49]MBF6642072.1 YtxH domain-containing protein [Flavobacterium sp. J49]NIC03320.1 YtxH domain-containing protein [Flavobacterium sp. J49]
MSTGKVVLGTLAGLAVGAVLGILFAPEKGSVTRKQIMDKGNDYADDVKSKYKEFADSISEKFQSAKNEAQGLAENGKAKFEDLKKDAGNAISSYKS